MPGDACIVCGNSRKKEPLLSYHRFPSDPEKQAMWIREFQLSEDQLKVYSRVCSRHFPDGDPRNKPELSLGKRFGSPIKKGTPRTKRAKLRQYNKDLQETMSAASSRSVTPLPSQAPSASHSPPSPLMAPLTALAGEQLEVDYHVHELPGECESAQESAPSVSTTVAAEQNLVSTALLACIEALEAENTRLKKHLLSKETKFGMEQIKHDRLVSFYTGFKSYVVFLASSS